jgi:ankyrin repeat protein
VRLLAARGAELEAANQLGNTPLLSAVAARQVATTRALLALGASTRIRNGAALNALDLARQSGADDLVRILEGR